MIGLYSIHGLTVDMNDLVFEVSHGSGKNSRKRWRTGVST